MRTLPSQGVLFDFRGVLDDVIVECDDGVEVGKGCYFHLYIYGHAVGGLLVVLLRNLHAEEEKDSQHDGY